jgi:hypothetical protein
MAQSQDANLGLQNPNTGFDSPLGLQSFTAIYTHLHDGIGRALTEKEWEFLTDEGNVQILRKGSSDPRDEYWKKYQTYRQYLKEYKSSRKQPTHFFRDTAKLGYYSSNGRIWSRYIVNNPRLAGVCVMRESLFDERLQARIHKDYAAADRIREYYSSLDVLVVDGVH